MTGYIIRRLLLMIPLLFGVSVITFVLINAAPGDPVTLMLAEARADPSTSIQNVEALKAKYGLDKPLPVRYVDWMSQVVRGNFGKSLVSGEDVRDIIARRLPNSVKLSGVAVLLALLVGLPLGVLSAVKQYSFWDHALTFLAFVGISIPTFWLGLMLLLIFGVWFHLVPTAGMRTFLFEGGFLASVWDSLVHYVLPVSAIALLRLAAWIRFQRSSMLEVIRQDYVRTARAKGLAENVVIFTHAWRNSLLSIITLFGFVLATVIEGSIVIEFIYTWPGMGEAVITSIRSRDYNVVMAAMMLSGAAIVIGTLLSDVLYAVVDPRVRYSR